MSLQELQELQELRQRVKEEQRLREEERRLRQQAEEQLRYQTQNTTLPEFLEACHAHLFLGLHICEDKGSITKGNPANADHKIRPTRIREWINFPKEQISIWDDLMKTDFVTERHFTPLLVLKEYGKEVRGRMLGSELDLGYFERHTVESRVSSVIKQLHVNPQLRQTFGLNGDVSFENHANTLTDDSGILTEMNSLSLSQVQPRRSGRLAAKSSSVQTSTQPPETSHNKATQPRNSRPRADQFCVYNKGMEGKVPAFIIEYKAPHKVSLSHIRAGLQDMDLDDVVRLQDDESPDIICRRVVAAVITQTFSYMIHAGLEYGYVCTGEAFIFLRVLQDDPSTVYYYLSVPEEDVGPVTWTGNPHDDNRLHLTALGQVLAFTLRALRVPTRDIAWTNRAVRSLKTWVMVYDILLDKILEKDIPSSAFKSPTGSRNEYCRVSPVKIRSKAAAVASCNSSQDASLLDHDDDDDDDDAGDDFDSNTPSRPPRERRLAHPPEPRSVATRALPQDSSSKGKSRQYCTQRCLRGLIKGGLLDRQCPNVSDHGLDRHRLTRTTLIRRLDRQFFGNEQQLTQLGCESLHVHGSRGALFKITLWSHGYTFVGKGTPVEFVAGSKHEESIYTHLTPIQGVYVPVLLGSLRLRHPFSYDGIAAIVHLMFMSYVGITLEKRHDLDDRQLIQQAERSLEAIHNLNVLQCDPMPRNMAQEDGRMMFIDFERATLEPRRMPLRGISPNRERKRETSLQEKSPAKHNHDDCFEREKRCMRGGLWQWP
ncbi:hypothetical protein BO70DRAFT_306788 [Aspergillus heteromorphus CBS 117.55]|uniref:Metalloprotease m41 ftsh n=1 Tax=Aspergillus heteromorphus CBS 117.55 TaxID=1448321 RepID=A0A317WW91_9EURO|nr:uncharacterized protein BO70DRAFT_306788 [Aspergillus heteromorphus CBS 117.55]PWY90674.1 hypothetical protein BO70DRAFT_306788 [Aspergillus heteromorphus CBS 117.55]